MSDHTFTKVLFAVELEGKAYGVELDGDKLLHLVQHAAKLSPNGHLSLSPLPNQRIFEMVFEKTMPH